MIDCMILGDSIAVGTHQFRPECVAYATGGYNSYQWNNKYNHKDFVASTVIISLGSNDHQYIKTFNELLLLRQSVLADRVYWIMPAIKPNIQEYIKIIAKNYNDIVLPIPALQKDKIHPSWAGYKELAEQTK